MQQNRNNIIFYYCKDLRNAVNFCGLYDMISTFKNKVCEFEDLFIGLPIVHFNVFFILSGSQYAS